MKLGHGLTLLLGGARSGKSDLAVKLGEAWPGSAVFVATATAGDEDMAQRIERHQAERPAGWVVVESPLFAAAEVAAVQSDSLLILDCITLLASNLTFDGRSEDDIADHIGALGAALAARTAPSLVISNEVGLGVHPETAMGRQYRDALGRANRALANQAETSLFIAAGKALRLQDLTITW